MTLRELMNRVLRATGQAQIPCETTVLDEENHLLMLEFINQFKEEIEGYNFRSLKQTHLTIVPPSTGLAFVGAPDTTVSGRSRLQRVHDARFGRLVPNVYDITDATKPFRLQEMDTPLIYDQLSMDGGQTAATPEHFSLDVNTAQLLVLRLYPVPNVQRTVGMTLFVPQRYLDVGDLDTEIWVPTRALTIGAIWYVLQERGEELGQGSMFTEERYRKALDDEVATDVAEAGDLELVPV